ncbi:MAG TPA: GNAT family N-acetyltransferase [Chthonomonadaceae bacterium]|nr:GNAT family N-acetyltransferase [Chthonomonadaceae bacterium]
MQQLFMRRPNLDDLPEIPPLPPGYTLREYQPGDLEPLAALMQKAFEDPQWTPEKVRKTLIDAPDVKKTFIIDYQGKPVATASARLLPEQYPGSGYVHFVAADPEHKGQRLGYIVSLAVLHEFVRLGCQDAVLETDDFRLPAIKTYQNLGFEPEHRHESHPERWAETLARLLAAAGL